MNDPPKNPENLQVEVEGLEFLNSQFRLVAGNDDSLDCRQHQAIDPLTKGEAVALWKTGGSIK